jgi:hypothetical protein
LFSKRHLCSSISWRNSFHSMTQKYQNFRCRIKRTGPKSPTLPYKIWRWYRTKFSKKYKNHLRVLVSMWNQYHAVWDLHYIYQKDYLSFFSFFDILDRNQNWRISFDPVKNSLQQSINFGNFVFKLELILTGCASNIFKAVYMFMTWKCSKIGVL